MTADLGHALEYVGQLQAFGECPRVRTLDDGTVRNRIAVGEADLNEVGSGSGQFPDQPTRHRHVGIARCQKRHERKLTLLLSLTIVQPGVAPTVAPDLREQWEAVHFGGRKSGHAHWVFDQVEAGGRPVIRSENQMELKLPRFGDTARMGMEAVCYETPGGRFYAFDCTLKQPGPGQDQVTEGRLDAAGRMELTLQTTGKTTKQTMDWPDDVIGMAALDRLTRKFAAGTDAEAKCVVFLPGMNQIADTVLKRVGKVKTTLAGGVERELLELRMEQSARPGKSKLPASRLWLDERGQTMKTEISLFGAMSVVSYALPKAAALADGAAVPANAQQDLGFQTLVPCPKLPDARTAPAVVYELELDDPEVAKAFPADANQKIVRLDGRKLTLKVLKRSPPPGAAPGKTDAEFLAPNGFVQSDDPAIVKVAKDAVGAEYDPWKQCQKLEHWVKTEMKHGDFSAAFLTASDALARRSGDCTEHGVLLAALCKAVGVPARVAVGLVYVDFGEKPALGYHLWTEVNLAGEWYALDGTLGQGVVGGDRLKLGDTSLKGASALGTFTPVFEAMGKFKVVGAVAVPNP